MINVCFPQGCYGTYFTRCLYNYTNLRTVPFIDFKFDNSGSSHAHRTNQTARSVIREGHIETLEIEPTSQVVTIIPCTDHKLDYCNNQFFKHSRGQLLSHLLELWPVSNIKHILNTQWLYQGEIDDTVPRWIIREWCSFWIASHLTNGYDIVSYRKLKSVAQFSTQDLFENFAETLTLVVASLGLTFTVNWDVINLTHSEFITLQKYHNSQHRCHQYVHDLLAGVDTEMVLHSIFDEAYIQHLLRQHNLEIQCDGLDIFPRTTQHLKTLTYETSNNYN